MWNQSRSLLLSKVLTVIFIGLLTVSIFALPSVVNGYIIISSKNPQVYVPLLITLYMSLLPAFAMLICLFKLLKNIGIDKVFISDNVRYLRIISWGCVVVALIYGIFGFYYLLSVLIAVAAAFVGIIVRVIKNIFKQAIEIKTENDLTI